MAKHPFPIKPGQPTIPVRADKVAEYNKKVKDWCRARGMDPGAELDDTGTLSPENTTALTNTPNQDDHVDNFTDQVADDSGD